MEVGDAVGLDAVEEKPEGLETHEYVSPLMADAPILTLVPAHTVVKVATLAEGSGLTVYVTEWVFWHPVAVMVSVKV